MSIYVKGSILCVLLILIAGVGTAQLGPGPPPFPRPFKIGDDGVTAPILQQFVSPVYPKEPLEVHYGGMAILWVVIAPDGGCRDVKVARSVGMGLDSAAISAVREWRFKSAQKDGKPVLVQMYIGISFNGERGATGASLDCHENKLSSPTCVPPME